MIFAYFQIFVHSSAILLSLNKSTLGGEDFKCGLLSYFLPASGYAQQSIADLMQVVGQNSQSNIAFVVC